MPRDRAKVHRRLQEAALELFEENGYEQTTAAQIAARANVTERTYFRHFSDKRDILFDGEEQLKELLATAIASAPAQLGPMPVLRRALQDLVVMMEARRGFLVPRQAVIAASPALREREATKQAFLTDAMAAALHARGLEAKNAQLAAQVSAAAFGHALASWFEQASPDLARCLDRALEQVRLLARNAPEVGAGSERP